METENNIRSGKDVLANGRSVYSLGAVVAAATVIVSFSSSMINAYVTNQIKNESVLVRLDDIEHRIDVLEDRIKGKVDTVSLDLGNRFSNVQAGVNGLSANLQAIYSELSMLKRQINEKQDKQ